MWKQTRHFHWLNFHKNFVKLSTNGGVRKSTPENWGSENLGSWYCLFGDEISGAAPELPRSDIYKYPFVTQPLYDLCPASDPQDGRTVSEIWQKMQQLDSLSVVDIKL